MAEVTSLRHDIQVAFDDVYAAILTDKADRMQDLYKRAFQFVAEWQTYFEGRQDFMTRAKGMSLLRSPVSHLQPHE